MKRFPKCEHITQNPIIPLEEKQSKIIFENPAKLEVCVLRVDHTEQAEGAIKDGIRCDFALTAEAIEAEFYIELKGSDIKHAFKPTFRRFVISWNAFLSAVFGVFPENLRPALSSEGQID
jgi:hypothetical protein